MIKRTPRPRRISSATFQANANLPIARKRSATGSGVSVPSSWRGPGKRQGLDEDNESFVSDYGTLLDKDASMDEKLLEGDGSESDSSIDIHTPLPCVFLFFSASPPSPPPASSFACALNRSLNIPGLIRWCAVKFKQTPDVPRRAALPPLQAAARRGIVDALNVLG